MRIVAKQQNSPLILCLYSHLSVFVFPRRTCSCSVHSPHAEFRAVRVQSCSLLVCHVVVGKSLADFDKQIVAGRLSTIQYLFRCRPISKSVHVLQRLNFLARQPTHKRKPNQIIIGLESLEPSLVPPGVCPKEGDSDADSQKYKPIVRKRLCFGRFLHDVFRIRRHRFGRFGNCFDPFTHSSQPEDIGNVSKV